jgi:hypothetical protein
MLSTCFPAGIKMKKAWAKGETHATRETFLVVPGVPRSDLPVA